METFRLAPLLFVSSTLASTAGARQNRLQPAAHA